MVTVGDTEIVLVVAEVFHEKVGEPVEVTVIIAELPGQSTVGLLEVPIVGVAVTVRLNEAVLVQAPKEAAEVAVKVYSVVDEGFAVIKDVVAFVLQVKLTAPLALSVAVLPEQIDPLAGELVIVNDGRAFTETVTAAVFEHPAPLLPVTVYVVVTEGVTTIEDVVCAVLQEKELALEAVKVADAPAQIVAAPVAVIEGGAPIE